MPQLTAQERIGTTLVGKYALHRILGEGGMGVVFAGTHLHLGRPVAVKLLRAEANTKDSLARFLTEARTSAALRHPNVVDVLDIDQESDGTVFMVQELLDGRSFGSVLHARQRLPLDEAYFVLRPVMQALIAAHEARIVHRDLKPDNIFLHRSGATLTPKVLDFGIAKLMEGRGHTTQDGIAMGTPRYMSPEQAQARDFGPWYDVWSVGVLWFETLTGTHPLDLEPSMPATSMMVRIITENPRRLRTLAPDLPRSITDLIDGALAKDRGKRPDMRTFERTLAEAFEAAHIKPRQADIESSVASPSLDTLVTHVTSRDAPHALEAMTEARPRPQPSRRVLVALAAVALAGLSGLGAAVWLYGARNTQPTVVVAPSAPEGILPASGTPIAPPPEVVVPRVTVPEVEAREALAPEVLAPEVVAPEVAPPEVAPPEVLAPEVLAPEVLAPEVALPEVQPPSVASRPIVAAPDVPTAPHVRPPHSTPHHAPSETRPGPHDPPPSDIELGTNGIPI